MFYWWLLDLELKIKIISIYLHISYNKLYTYYFIFKVLELRSGATQTEIKNQCRTLAVKYHPDKAKDDETRKDVQNRFFEVQQACELLSNSRAKRRRKNKQFNEEL